MIAFALALALKSHVSIAPRTPRRFSHTLCAAPPPSAAPPPPSSAKAPSRVYEYVSWGDVETLAASLVTTARKSGYDVLVAVTRGGLAPAALVAEGLGVRTVLAATVMLYTDEGDPFFGLRDPRVLAFPAADLLAGRRVLIVDDVWDSGRTASVVAERTRRAEAAHVAVAVLHYKPTASEVDAKPDYYATTTSRWIVYPWERASAAFATGQ